MSSPRKRRLKYVVNPGDVFEAMTVIEPTVGKSRTHRYFLCLCVCGKRVARRADFLVKGRAKSCGCLHPRNNWGKDNPSFKGVGDLGSWYYNCTKGKAVIRDICFNVSPEYLWELFCLQEGKCALTGLPIKLTSGKGKSNGREQTASLDRRDSKKGYVPGNLWWVHKYANKMKREYSLERYVEFSRLVARNYDGALPYKLDRKMKEWEKNHGKSTSA